MSDNGPRWLIRQLIRAENCTVDALQAHAIELSAAQRRRGRQRLVLADGQVLALALSPGLSMNPGDQLLAKDGTRFEICAALESVLRIRAQNPVDLARAAYHLGNRHIAVEIGEDYLAIEPDAVLLEMLDGLGVTTELVDMPFAPETGAYGGGHKHGHDESFAEDSALALGLFQQHAHVHAHPHLDSHAHDG